NKAKALRILRARILEREQKKQKDEIDRDRKSQIGSGERSERIRTYNYPQNRMTDHRINLTLYRLDTILEGDLEEIIESLASDEKARILEKVG
ncbi:MAG: peptide chain release factor 1, partial [Candidatus Atribacteria bacterium]|nr:peptide chain release factor 1 [Candidatus Atribacteria bacterium]